MNDLIDRQAAIDALEREKTYSTVYRDGYTQTDYFKQYNMGLTDGIKALNKLPSAQPDVHDRKVGKWIYLTGLDAFECSVCGRQMVRNIFDYCPWCGSKMRGDEDE